MSFYWTISGWFVADYVSINVNMASKECYFSLWNNVTAVGAHYSRYADIYDQTIDSRTTIFYTHTSYIHSRFPNLTLASTGGNRFQYLSNFSLLIPLNIVLCFLCFLQSNKQAVQPISTTRFKYLILKSRSIDWNLLFSITPWLFPVIRRWDSHNLAKYPGKIVWISVAYFGCYLLYSKCTLVQQLAGIMYL